MEYRDGKQFQLRFSDRIRQLCLCASTGNGEGALPNRGAPPPVARKISSQPFETSLHLPKSPPLRGSSSRQQPQQRPRIPERVALPIVVEIGPDLARSTRLDLLRPLTQF